MQLEKFGFRIRAQNGAQIDHLIIQAADPNTARDKLLRMYPHCEILSSWMETNGQTGANGKSFEDIADIINH